MSSLLPSFVKLEPVAHRYFDPYGCEYLSVSAIKKMLTEPFDPKVVSYFSARKQLRVEMAAQGRTGEPIEEDIQRRAKALRFQWEAKNKDGIDSGNVVHNAAEDYLKHKLLPADERLGRAIKLVCDTVILPGVQIPYSEEVIYSKKYYIAGTADFLGQVKGGKFPVINIDDFKTNKSKGIQYHSEYGNWMKAVEFDKEYTGVIPPDPVAHLEACSYNDYVLQLSLYAHMLEEHGYRPARMRLIYMHPDDPENYQVIPVPYMRQTILDILSYLEAAGKIRLRTPAKIQWV